MNDLRTALHEVADGTPRVDVPAHDLWRQGRVVRRRERATTLVAVALLVMVVAGLGAVVNPVKGIVPAGEPEAPDGALPTSVEKPKGPLAHQAPGGARLEKDLAPGRVSVARGEDWTGPVLVGADDGAHHVVDLPHISSHLGFMDTMATVSPDGTLLAYLWRAEAAPTRAGIALLDLVTGEVDTYDVEGDNGVPVAVGHISWSTDSSHVAWVGHELGRWEHDVVVGGEDQSYAGILRVEDRDLRTWRLVRKSSNDMAVAVSDDGDLFVLGGRWLWTTLVEPMVEGRLEVVTRRVVEEHVNWFGASVRSGRLVAGDRDGGGIWSLDVGDLGTVAVHHEWPGLTDEQDVAILGWSPEGGVVGAVHGWDGRYSSAEVQVLREGKVSRVTEFEPIDVYDDSEGEFQMISVATDLADSEPVDFTAPNWPMSDERRAFLVVLGVGGLGVVAWLAYLVVRRRRQPPSCAGPLTSRAPWKINRGTAFRG